MQNINPGTAAAGSSLNRARVAAAVQTVFPARTPDVQALITEEICNSSLTTDAVACCALRNRPDALLEILERTTGLHINGLERMEVPKDNLLQPGYRVEPDFFAVDDLRRCFVLRLENDPALVTDDCIWLSLASTMCTWTRSCAELSRPPEIHLVYIMSGVEAAMRCGTSSFSLGLKDGVPLSAYPSRPQKQPPVVRESPFSLHLCISAARLSGMRSPACGT